MVSNRERFLRYANSVFGRETAIKRVDGPSDTLPVFVFFYRDWPEEGLMTAVTFGLSSVGHPRWQKERPELVLTLESLDTAWGVRVAQLVAEFRGKNAFDLGDIFATDAPIAPGESAMSAFVVFPSPLPSGVVETCELNGYTMRLRGIYPIFESEAKLVRAEGMGALWKAAEFDPLDVGRSAVVSDRN